MDLIYSEEEIKKFYSNVLPPLSNSEVYFVSLSARNKYLTQEERVLLNLGRTEMFERRIVRNNDYNKFIRTIKKFEVKDGSYTTKNNSIIPDKCIICYININPSNTLKALNEFNKTINEYYLEISICASEGRDPTNILSRINKCDTLLMNCFQRNRGKKHYIDVDFDTKNALALIAFTDELTSKEVEHHIIETKSGFHVLLKSDTITYNFTKKLNELNNESVDGEIVVNKNGMVPLPGTLQGGYKVKLIY